MGTRSTTSFVQMPEGKTILRMYAQLDGYFTGLGAQLAELTDRNIVNGYGLDQTDKDTANGLGCLAASVVANLKEGLGNFYIQDPELTDFEEYNYRVEVEDPTGFGETNRPVLVAFEGSEEKFRGDPKDFAAFVREYEA